MYVLTCKCVCICIQYTCKNGIKFWWAFTVCHQVSPINCYRFNTDIARIQLHCNVDMRTNFFFKALLDAAWKGSLKLQLMPIWLETLHSGPAVNNFGLTGVREDHNLVLEMMWISATRKRIRLGILLFSPLYSYCEAQCKRGWHVHHIGFHLLTLTAPDFYETPQAGHLASTAPLSSPEIFKAPSPGQKVQIPDLKRHHNLLFSTTLNANLYSRPDSNGSRGTFSETQPFSPPRLTTAC